jgi:hypothetical protein
MDSRRFENLTVPREIEGYKHSGMTDWEQTSQQSADQFGCVKIHRTAFRTLNVLGMKPNDAQLIRREQLILAIRGQLSGTKV